MLRWPRTARAPAQQVREKFADLDEKVGISTKARIASQAARNAAGKIDAQVRFRINAKPRARCPAALPPAENASPRFC